MLWKFLVSDKRIGSVKIVSPSTHESYEITPWGTWVPTIDFNQIKDYERQICCDRGNGLVWIKAFAEGNPTVDRPMPTRLPDFKEG